jgi:hypothetical protein
MDYGSKLPPILTSRSCSPMRVTLNEESQAIWQSQNLEHLRYEYDLKPDDVVIDLGAYCGEWANEIRARYGCCVIAVEPTDSIDGYACEYIKKAAWTHDGKLKFGGAFYYSSAFENPVREYECFDVNSLLSRFDEIALLKCNVEGAEYQLLNHIIDAGLHKRIRNLQVQFHLIEDEPVEEMYGAIASKLRETHRIEWRHSFCWESWRRSA